jgi:cytochrome c oxidase assembly protein subunit 15
MTHRYLAGILGIATLIIAILAWRSGTYPWLASTLVMLVIAQALLGMWTVTMLLKPVIVTLHLVGGMATLALTCWIAMAARERQILWARSVLGGAALIGILLLFAQIALGGWVSSHYAGLACGDFPLCDGSLIPAMDMARAFSLEIERTDEAMTAIQWTHRVGALIVLIYLTWLSTRAMRFQPLEAFCVLLLVWLQLGLGAANVWLRLPLSLAVAHNAIAALLLITMVVLNFRLRRHPATPGG